MTVGPENGPQTRGGSRGVLIYCILRAPRPATTPTRRGVGGRPVILLTHQKLSVALSRIAPPVDLAPHLSNLRVYQEVVAALHREGTVIPMRYGCCLADEAQVRRLLAERGPHYEALLRELDGCVEMGIRIILPQAGIGSPPAVPPALEANPGWTYLKARQTHYDQVDRWAQAYQEVTGRCRASLAGLYVQEKREGPSSHRPGCSLYFLVRREAVAAFRRACRSVIPAPGVKLLLSGPWPPYNFVMTAPPSPGPEKN